MTNNTLKSINARQIKAARALLDWSQDRLAEACGLSIATIRKIESGHISPRDSTTSSIEKAFEAAGLEFLGADGVRRKPEDMVVYHGHDGTVAFFDDVYQTVSKRGGEIVVVCVSEHQFADALDDYLAVHVARMKAIQDKVSVKCIITDKTDYTPADYCEYRHITKAYVESVPFYIYGNNYAILLFDADPSPKIIVHKSALLAEAYRRQFASMWEKATILSARTKTETAPKRAIKR